MSYLIPIIVVFGFYNISTKINDKLNLNLDKFHFSIISFLIFLGIVVLLIFSKLNTSLASDLILIILFISFINYIYLSLNFIKSFLKNYKGQSFLFFLFGILTLIPIAGADSYAYHLAWPKNLIDNSEIVFDKLFLESRVVGIGEIVNYIGLALGTENLLSFLSYVSLCSYIYLYKKKNKTLIFLIILSSPIYYKYLLDQKPFILPCIFLIIFIDNLFLKIKKKNIDYFSIVGFLLSLSFFANSKYPFLLIGLFIYLFFFCLSIKEKFFLKYFILSIIIFSFHFIPLPLMKLIVLGDPFSPFLEGIFNNPDKDILKLREMYKSWDGFKVSQGETFYFEFISLLRNIFNFFIPIAPFTILDTFGASVLIIFFMKFNSNLEKYFSIIIFLIIMILVFLTNFQSRWFLFIFLYIILNFDYLESKKKIITLLKKYLFFIATILILFHSFYLIMIIKNSLLNGFEDTLNKHVYLFKEIKEIEKISKENYVITNTRGNFFYKNLIQYKYQDYSKKYLLENKNLSFIKYGFFSTGTYEISNDQIFKKTVLRNFDQECVKVLYNRLNLVAKRNIFSRKDYENFIFVKFKKPIHLCFN